MFKVFKNKKSAETPKESKEPKQKKEPVEAAKPVKSSGWSGGILTAPHVTEKSSRLGGMNQYVFRVTPDANKIEIARAVEKKYGVNVVRVNTMNVSGKRVRIGKREGRSPGFKKAMVTIQEGQSIEIQ